MLRPGEIIIDGFAGGGGASEGVEQGTGHTVDVAINHDEQAIAMHETNHPWTRHFCENIFAVDPLSATEGRPVGLGWFSPDCKHFSKAKGGALLDRKIRGLAWVVKKWIGRGGRGMPGGRGPAAPRVVILENVEEFQTWGPLLNRKPDPKRKGLYFRRFVAALRAFGYAVEWRELRACDYGAPTIRKRLYLIARCDGAPIAWPEPTHGSGRLPYRTAANCIDWSISCPSIFSRKKPLAEATLRRIAEGLRRYVIETADPFIIPVTHSNDSRVYGINEPLRTTTTARRGEFAVVAPYLVPRYGERPGQAPRTQSIEMPLSTIVPTGNGAQLVAAFLAQHNGGMVGHRVTKPFSTITQGGSQQQLVTSHVVKLRNNGHGQDVREPLHTVAASGNHLGEVRAFLVKYYGAAGHGQDCREPLHTLSTKPRFGLVTVAGEEYQIVDIGMRMLTPRERYRAQGFPDNYIIDLGFKGKPLTQEAQGRMCGNSVCPPVAKALARANLGASEAEQEAA